MLHMFLSFFVVTFFRPSPSDFETESQSFQFIVKNLVCLSLLGEGGAKHFSLGPKPIFGGPATTLTTNTTTYAAATMAHYEILL